MNIQSRVNKYGHYGPFYGPGYANHLPMAQYALFSLGAKEKDLETFESVYLEDHLLVEPVEIPVEISSIESAFGQREAYLSYVEYFQDLVEREGIEKTLRYSVNTLYKGMGTALFHGLIRLAYAVTSDNQYEIVRALAYWACAYQATDLEGRRIPPSMIKPEFIRYIAERDKTFYLMGTEDEKERTLVEALSELFLSTGSFIVLHTITGFEAITTLRKYVDNYSEALDYFTVAVLKALLRVTQDDYKKIYIESDLTWEVIHERAIGSKEAHTIKLVYSVNKLNKLYPLDALRKVAMVQLTLND